MIGFAQIAGGMPSSASAMGAHLMNNTVSHEQSKLAAYYARGGAVEPSLMAELARDVADKRVDYSEALDTLMTDYVRRGGSLDEAAMTAADERLGHRLAVLSERMAEGLDDAPLAVVRPDIDPRVMTGLGIEPDGLLSKAEVNALLAGRRADGELIDGKRYAPEKRLPVDPKTGEQRWSTPIGSYDFCPTPDKSVSISWGFAEPVEQAMILQAHLEAARAAVGYIAAEVGKVRLGDGGKDSTEKALCGWIEFTHHTSRRVQITAEGITADGGLSGDPDLHTHFLIPNATFSAESDKVGSLDTAAIRGFIFEADAFYHATLAQNLRDAGFEAVLDPKTGAARMPIVPDEVRTLFSKRTNVGETLARQYTAARGEVWDELTDAQRAARMKAATQSREQKSKGDKDPIADFYGWRKQAKEAHGWAPTSLQLYGPPERTIEGPERARLAYETALPFIAEKLTQQSVLTQWDLRVAALRGLVKTGISGLADVAAVTKLMWREGVEQYGEKTAILFGQEPGKRAVAVTTVLHEDQEQAFIQLAKAANADRSGAVPARMLRQTIDGSGLDFTDTHGRAQRAAIERIGTGGRFGLIIGSAGMGKTASLRPLVAAWHEQGREVWGASLAWRQADDLADSGIDRRNVKAFSVLLDGLAVARDNPRSLGAIHLTRQSVVAIDEWGLIGTRQALELLRHRDRIGFSIVALGDDKQCAAVEAGPIIDLSRRALGKDQVPEILTTKRQQTEREREIVGLLREGRAAEALEMKREDGTAEMVSGGRERVIARVAALYAERLRETGEAPGINAPTNRDAHDISVAVRAERRKLGQLEADMRTVPATDGERDYPLALAAGDRVRLFRSTPASFGAGKGGSIGRNGSVVEVVDADDRGLAVRAKSGRVGTIAWNDLQGASGRVRLAYGDALTIHTAQGSSRREQISAFPDGTERVLGQATYSAMTRHHLTGWMVTSEQAERVSVRKRRPLNDVREVTVADKWANVARSLAFQPEKDSAVAMRERVGAMRRGGVTAFQRTLLPAEPGQRAGKALSQGPDVAQGQRVAAQMRPDMPALKQAVQRGVEQVRQAYRRVARPTQIPIQSQRYTQARGQGFGLGH